MKMREEVKKYRKEIVFENYTRIIEEFKCYDKISKVKIIDEIYKDYQKIQPIIDICTVRELKYLQKLIKNDLECQDGEKYQFEIYHLRRKFLIFPYPEISIPEEIYDCVCQALKQVDWKVAKEKDRINEVVVGICRVYGELMAQPLIQISCPLLGISVDDMNEHFCYNRLFKYYVYFKMEYFESLQKEMPMFVYQDYYDILEELDEARRKYGIAHSKEIDIQDFIHIFYYGFNTNRPIVKKMYQKLMETRFHSIFIDPIQRVVLLNGDREPLFEYIEKFIGNDQKLFELIDQAMDEMPSAALNGATPKEAKYFRLEEERNHYKKEVHYIKQRNARLSKKEVKTFYQIYFAILEFTNNKYKINERIKKIYKQTRLNPQELISIVEKFWKEKEIIIDEFLEKNPYRFNSYELNLVEGMKKGYRDTFILARYEEDYTCLLGNDKCYMIKGLNDNLDQILSYKELPCMVITAIMPFMDQIIYDGIFQTSQGISFGSGFETMVEDELEKVERVYHL